MTALVLAAMAVGALWGVGAFLVEQARDAVAVRRHAVGRSCVPAPRRPAI